jgi:hypothetical protein
MLYTGFGDNVVVQPKLPVVMKKVMPTIYRAMKRANDGAPFVGSNSKELGVRVPPNPNGDIDLDENGNVVLNGKGMSVAENWRRLLPHLVPKRLKPILPRLEAIGPLMRLDTC